MPNLEEIIAQNKGKLSGLINAFSACLTGGYTREDPIIVSNARERLLDALNDESYDVSIHAFFDWNIRGDRGFMERYRDLIVGKALLTADNGERLYHLYNLSWKYREDYELIKMSSDFLIGFVHTHSDYKRLKKAAVDNDDQRLLAKLEIRFEWKPRIWDYTPIYGIAKYCFNFMRKKFLDRNPSNERYLGIQIFSSAFTVIGGAAVVLLYYFLQK